MADVHKLSSRRIVLGAAGNARACDVVLLPPHYVKVYRRRNKTDRADCEALLEADRCAGIKPVTIKSEDQQALMALHRVRAQWMASRTARINTIRGLLAEFGLIPAAGSQRFLNDLHLLLARKQAQVPERVRRTVLTLWEEVRELEQRIDTLESELERIAVTEPAMQALTTAYRRRSRAMPGCRIGHRHAERKCS